MYLGSGHYRFWASSFHAPASHSSGKGCPNSYRTRPKDLCWNEGRTSASAADAKIAGRSSHALIRDMACNARACQARLTNGLIMQFDTSANGVVAIRTYMPLSLELGAWRAGFAPLLVADAQSVALS